MLTAGLPELTSVKDIQYLKVQIPLLCLLDFVGVELSYTCLFHSNVQREWNKVISCEMDLTQEW